jgi:hypothetical protein
MRFGFAIGDTGIREHVQRIDLRTDYILALFDDDLDVVAAAHIAWARDEIRTGLLLNRQPRLWDGPPLSARSTRIVGFMERRTGR